MAEPRTLTSPKHLRLGSLLREARVATGLSQAKLAEMLGHQQAFVSKFEKGARGLDAIDFLAIVELVGCDIDRLIAELKAVEGE